ncbi:MAG TPA: glycosyltransferase family 9 protein, partial [Anaerolineales bacterium]|nr:glycosyltransferase family 9 protein [Anaerolineales bacterium]
MKLFSSDQSTMDQIAKADLAHVLIMQLDDSSAVVMLSPALRALREALPHAQLTLLTTEAGSQMAPLLPWVDHVMVDQAMWQDGTGSRLINPREEIAFIERLRRHDFSIALIFSSVSQSPLRAAFACYLAGIPYRVGFAKGMSGSILSHSLLPPADELHQVDRNLNLLRAIGISEADQRMELNIPQNVENRANELLGLAGLKLNTPYVVLAPGSMGTLGPYAPDHFAAVARILAAQTEQQLVIVGNSAEAKTIQPVLKVVHENLYGNVHSLVEKTTLPELAAIIRQANLTIANQSSVSMHLADVFRCPMVILHSEMDTVNQWMPRNSSVRLLSRPAACAHCNQVNCMHGINCLDVRPEEVAIAALELLTKQTYNQSEYKGIFNYKMEAERNQQPSAREI